MRSLSRVSTRSLVTALISLGLIGAAAQVSAETMTGIIIRTIRWFTSTSRRSTSISAAGSIRAIKCSPAPSTIMWSNRPISSETPDQAFFPSRFHEDATPRPLYVPGGM